MEELKISVIIPAYNAGKTIGECLKSILSQDYKNYEVIVVDNNSTDNTKEVIKEFQEKNKQVKYLFEQMRARGAARNTGEKAATGDIILMTDSDCIVPNDWMEKMSRPIISEGYDAVQGFEENASDNFWGRHQKIASLRKLERTAKDDVIGKIDTKNFAIKRESLKKIGFTARKYLSGNDTELSIRLAKNNLKVKFLMDIKVKHFHPNSLKEAFRRQIYRARWTTIITCDNIDYLKNTNFLGRTNQTVWTFVKFFPGLIKTLILEGAGYMYFDIITGLSWRIGLVSGWISEKSVSLFYSMQHFIYPFFSPTKKLTQANVQLVSSTIRHIYGPEKIDYGQDELIVTCLVRDGEEYIKSFIQHYTALGAKHIVFLDNMSKDHTVDIACKYDNVTVFQTSLSYRKYKYNLKAYLKDLTSQNHWCIFVDIDELFDYPFSNIITLKELLHYLNKNSFNAVLANMLDMFSDKPLNCLEERKDINLKEEYRFYDISDFIQKPATSLGIRCDENLKIYSGGIRKYAFNLKQVEPLFKYLLFYRNNEFSVLDIREHKIKGNVRMADFSCVLFHYKMTGALLKKSIRAIKDKNYYRDSYEYKEYYKILSSRPELNIKQIAQNPRELKDTQELIDNGFLYVSNKYLGTATVFK